MGTGNAKSMMLKSIVGDLYGICFRFYKFAGKDWKYGEEKTNWAAKSYSVNYFIDLIKKIDVEINQMQNVNNVYSIGNNVSIFFRHVDDVFDNFLKDIYGILENLNYKCKKLENEISNIGSCLSDTENLKYHNIISGYMQISADLSDDYLDKRDESYKLLGYNDGKANVESKYLQAENLKKAKDYLIKSLEENKLKIEELIANNSKLNKLPGIIKDFYDENNDQADNHKEFREIICDFLISSGDYLSWLGVENKLDEMAIEFGEEVDERILYWSIKESDLDGDELDFDYDSSPTLLSGRKEMGLNR